jgi:hypothetical protein
MGIDNHHLDHEYIFLKIDDDREIVMKRNEGRGDHLYNYIGELEDCGDSWQLHTSEDDIIVAGRWWSRKRIGCINGEVGWVCRNNDFLTHHLGKMMFAFPNLVMDGIAEMVTGDEIIDEEIKGLTNDEVTAFITDPPYPYLSKKIQRIFFGEVREEDAPEETEADDGTDDDDGGDYEDYQPPPSASTTSTTDDDDYDDYPTSRPSNVPTPPPVQAPAAKPVYSEYEHYLATLKDETNMESLAGIVRTGVYAVAFKEAALSKITDQELLVKLYWENRGDRELGRRPLNGLRNQQILDRITDQGLRAEIEREEDNRRCLALSKMDRNELINTANNSFNCKLSMEAAEKLLRMGEYSALGAIGGMHPTVRQYAKQHYNSYRCQAFFTMYCQFTAFIVSGICMAGYKAALFIFKSIRSLSKN